MKDYFGDHFLENLLLQEINCYKELSKAEGLLRASYNYDDAAVKESLVSIYKTSQMLFGIIKSLDNYVEKQKADTAFL